MAVKNTDEQHPYFPSGEWEGFYLYQNGPSATRHPMAFRLRFRNGLITGSGSDDVGALTWSGTYDTTTMSVTLIKAYASHEVPYSGMADANGIYGTWQLLFMCGGFHIWPKKQKRKTEKQVGKKKKKKKLAGV